MSPLNHAQHLNLVVKDIEEPYKKSTFSHRVLQEPKDDESDREKAFGIDDVDGISMGHFS
jgi:hypothetical protein